MNIEAFTSKLIHLSRLKYCFLKHLLLLNQYLLYLTQQCNVLINRPSIFYYSVFSSARLVLVSITTTRPQRKNHGQAKSSENAFRFTKSLCAELIIGSDTYNFMNNVQNKLVFQYRQSNLFLKTAMFQQELSEYLDLRREKNWH